jgi:hypothetical protein
MEVYRAQRKHILYCGLTKRSRWLFLSHQMAACYSSNQNGGLQSPEKAYFVLWINEEKSMAVFRLRFHKKIRKKGSGGVAKLLV